ncbi:hypothetical protein CR513_32841, partial [Mucuna pruriens]
MNIRNQDISNPNVLTLKRSKRGEEETIHQEEEKPHVYLEDLDLSSSEDEDKEANLCLMANTIFEDEDDEKPIKTSFKFLISSFIYKELKRKFSKLSKYFESLEKESSILKKENLKEEHTNNLYKVNTYEVIELQKEVINLRQNLAKFVNGTKNLNKLLKYNKSSHDKSSLDFEKDKEIIEKPNIHYSIYRKFGHRSYDCRERPKGPSIRYQELSLTTEWLHGFSISWLWIVMPIVSLLYIFPGNNMINICSLGSNRQFRVTCLHTSLDASHFGNCGTKFMPTFTHIRMQRHINSEQSFAPLDNHIIFEFLLRVHVLTAIGDVVPPHEQLDVILEGLLEDYESIVSLINSKFDSLFVNKAYLNKFKKKVVASINFVEPSLYAPSS